MTPLGWLRQVTEVVQDVGATMTSLHLRATIVQRKLAELGLGDTEVYRLTAEQRVEAETFLNRLDHFNTSGVHSYEKSCKS